MKVDMNIESLEGLPMLVVRDVPLDAWTNRFLKRVFDIGFASVAIILSSPVMIFVALGIKITSPGPVFFKQERISQSNKPFNMLKFRSMKVQTQSDTNVIWTTQNDPRKTKFGSFIRKTSLDELPQFFNVLFGQMSIVGPRPERPYWVNKFKEEIPDYMLRHYVKSGITGWAQVNGWRGDTSIEERIKCDNFYIQNWSLMLDIKIIFLTVFKGFINKNAY
jgi:Undecaprenyl-phosphate glucose phosphotransferase